MTGDSTYIENIIKEVNPYYRPTSLGYYRNILKEN